VQSTLDSLFQCIMFVKTHHVLYQALVAEVMVPAAAAAAAAGDGAQPADAAQPGPTEAGPGAQAVPMAGQGHALGVAPMGASGQGPNGPTAGWSFKLDMYASDSEVEEEEAEGEAMG
jgi:hypothetical protein